MSESIRSFFNKSGILLSFACVIHCMLMPIVIVSLPSWGLSWLASPLVHKTLAVVGIIIGMWTLIPGWKNHRRMSVLVLAGTGLLIMNYAAFGGSECCAGDLETASFATASSEASACCTASCCSATASQQASSQEVENSQAANTGSLIISGYKWLIAHPTALGALLLAWAHCMNGVCTRPCCANEPSPEV